MHRLESPGFTPKEEKSFCRMCYILSSALIPHVNNCIRLLFPLEQVSNVVGYPVAQLQREVSCIL